MYSALSVLIANQLDCHVSSQLASYNYYIQSVLMQCCIVLVYSLIFIWADDADGCTPLHKATERGDAETCQLLVSVVLYECLFCKVFVIVVYVYIDLVVET